MKKVFSLRKFKAQRPHIETPDWVEKCIGKTESEMHSARCLTMPGWMAYVFDWDAYKRQEFIVLCETEEEAREFCQGRHDNGVVDCLGRTISPWMYQWWRRGTDCRFQKGTAFRLGAHSPVEYYEEHYPNLPIYKWSDFYECGANSPKTEEEPEPEIDLLPYQWEISMNIV